MGVHISLRGGVIVTKLKKKKRKKKESKCIFKRGVILNNYTRTQFDGERAIKSIPHSHHLYQKSLSRSFAIQISVIYKACEFPWFHNIT